VPRRLGCAHRSAGGVSPRSPLRKPATRPGSLKAFGRRMAGEGRGSSAADWLRRALGGCCLAGPWLVNWIQTALALRQSVWLTNSNRVERGNADPGQPSPAQPNTPLQEQTLTVSGVPLKAWVQQLIAAPGAAMPPKNLGPNRRPSRRKPRHRDRSGTSSMPRPASSSQWTKAQWTATTRKHRFRAVRRGRLNPWRREAQCRGTA